MGLGGAISSLLSLGSKLLPAVVTLAQDPSSSSSPSVDQNHQIESELMKLMRMLERINTTLYDAEQREITDSAVKLWLKELKGVAYRAEDVLGEYHYEVLRAKVEARDASPPDSRKRKLIQVPSGMLDQIQQIRSSFDEISNDRIALQLSEGDGPMCCNNELQIAQTSHLVVQSDVFGRESEKEKLIDLLSSECDGVSVVTIVGMGGIGKTTVAQLACNDQRIQQRFDKFGWICVSEDFNVERLTKESFESIIGNKCDLTNLSYMQAKIQREISGKRVLLVLDDVWNENKDLWALFRIPFMSGAVAKILVTTRNNHVAQIMQTEPTLNLGYLSAEQCWRLFEHYAFGGVEQKKSPKLVQIGKQIMNKCGLLPLAVKSIASLLRHEGEEENWRDILESELWEFDVKREIISPLQISYARLPTYLKSCFLYCSMFPKDCEYDVEELVTLWISQGFIVSKGNKTAEKIGFEYALQLCQRSLFERVGRYEGKMERFKLHDIVHDLARVNSENSCYSIEFGKVLIFPNVLSHLYIADFVNLIDPIPSGKFTDLRTLITGSYFEILNSTVDLSMASKLRALSIFGLNSTVNSEFESLSSIGNLKHLRYLSLTSLYFETFPECICSLYSLQNLTLGFNPNLKELPTKIGNLMSLEELKIHGCYDFAMLPDSLCQLKALRKLDILNGKLEVLPSDIGSLTNLQTLKIIHARLSYLPPSGSKFVGIQSLKVQLICETIGWLKDFPDLGGALCLYNLDYISNLMDVQCANLVSMRNLKDLILCWRRDFYHGQERSVLELKIKHDEKLFAEEQSCFPVMSSLQPHPNLRKLKIDGYDGNTFPEWIGSLCKLKFLHISYCNSLQFLKADSLPLALRKLVIVGCNQLVSISGMQKLRSLVQVSIKDCGKLCSFLGPSLEGSQGSSSNITNFWNKWRPAEPCKVEVYLCPGLEQWCLHHAWNRMRGTDCRPFYNFL
ncbi:putative disease resistance protein RGA4 isoform X2 [Carex rostrata]